MIYGITYCDESMTKAAGLCAQSMNKNGVTRAFKVSPPLEEWFYRSNKDILEQKRGAGYWLWKPHLIYDFLLADYIDEGDYLIYSDAGVEFIGNVNHIISRMDQDVFLFGNNWRHIDWCKGDVLNAIQDATDERQVQASVIFIRKSPESVRFVKEWLLWCQMPGLIDDSPSVTANAPTFQEHRHDQAILTCLQIKHGYRLHWWPASYSDGAFVYDKLPQYAGDDYPVLFNHHRKRNNEY
jgi:hypothetical protein